jgi:hypothetical protein
MCRARCGRGFGPVVRQTAEWMDVNYITGVTDGTWNVENLEMGQNVLKEL